jgi:hypothetical protein
MSSRIIVVTAAVLLGVSTAAYAMFNQALNLSIKVTPPTPINGVCGSANGVETSSAPTSNLCNAGSASSVTGTGPWNWTCNGSNGGTNASCSAPLTGSGGSVPAPAQAAGFTTPVLVADFSQSRYATTPGDWLRCQDGSGAASPQWYQNWIGFGQGIMAPCNSVSQQNDTAPGGGLALQLHWQDSYYNGSLPVSYSVIETVDNAGNGNRIPPNAYFEAVARYDVPGDHTTMDIWSFTVNSSIEWDGIEAWFPPNFGGDSSTQIHNNDSVGVQAIWSGSPPTFGSSFDFSQYHTYAWRVTSSGPGGQGFWCSYIDGQQQGSCRDWGATASQLDGIDQTMQIDSGMVCRGTPSPCTPSGMNVWLKSVRIFSCAGFNSGQKCFTGNPNP